MIHKVIIIGAGPAGYTAAIYTARFLLSPLVFTGLDMGQIAKAPEVENFPGFVTPVSGLELLENFRKQAERLGACIVDRAVTKVDFSGRPFRVWSDEQEYQSLSVIIATGASPRWLGLESEQKLIGRGVSACAVCDGKFFKDKDVVVVGGGDTALDDAIFLTGYCRSVTVIHRRDKLRASEILQKRALSNPKIKFMFDSVVDEIYDTEAGRVTGVKITNTKTRQSQIYSCEGVFVAIGHVPNTSLFTEFLDLDQGGYIKTIDKTTRTSVDGVFACGDVIDPTYKQAVVAAGSGCIAAIDCQRYLHENNLISPKKML